MEKMNHMDESTDLVIHIGNEVQNVTIDQFPEVIAASLRRVEELDKKYLQAEKTADKAKKKVEDAAKVAEKAKGEAKKAVEKADSVSGMKAGFGHKKAAIEGLQEGHSVLAKSQSGIADAVGQITDVQGDLAKAQADTMDALKISFEFDKDITNITKYLFLLGCSSITASQTVCRTLEMKLKDASEEEISEFARQELQSVVDNLKAQESMMRRQKQVEEDLDVYIDVVNKNREAISEHERILDEQKSEIQKRIKKDIEQDASIKEQEKINSDQDKQLAEQMAVDKEHNKRLDAGEKRDAEQDEILIEQKIKDEEHDRRLNEGDLKDKQQDEKIDNIWVTISSNNEKMEKLSLEIDAIQKITSENYEEVNKLIEALASKKQLFAVGFIGVVAVILGIINLFI